MTTDKSTNTVAAKANKVRIANENAAMVKGLGDYIVDTMTNWTDVYYHEDNLTGGGKDAKQTDGWRNVDTMDFHKRIMLERMIGHYEYWLPKQADRESKAKYFADRYKAEYSPDSELSRNNFMGAVARYKGDHMLTTLMNAELSNLQAAYKAQYDRSYSSLKTTAVDGDLPSDIAAMMKEMDAMDAVNEEPATKAA